MSNTEIISKDDNTQKVFLSEDTIDVVDILQNNYPYIYESILKEEFILKYDKCNLFKELLFENKVVGFCSYDFSREFITVALNNIYVLPEFRGNNIFIDELKKTMKEHNKPSIMEPTRLIVELLIEYGFAVRINDDLVASAVELVVPGEHVLSNGVYNGEELSTHFYDLSICSCIHILNIKSSYIAYSSPLNYDIIHYDNVGCVDEEYVNNLVYFFENNDVELMNTILKLEDALPIKNYSLEEVIGGEGEFSFYIESMIDDAHITESKALEIKQQIKEEYEAGMILNESLLIRLAYLFNENPNHPISSHDDNCYYCNMPVDSHDKYCHFCGINLDYNPHEVEKDLIKSINEMDNDFKEDLRFIAYKFLRLIDDAIEVEYSIFTIENMFNCPWSVLNKYLTSHNYFKNNKITKEGFNFLTTHPLYFWQKYHMDIVNYNDFEEYFYNNIDLKPVDICLNYLQQFDNDEDILDIISEIKDDIVE